MERPGKPLRHAKGMEKRRKRCESDAKAIAKSCGGRLPEDRQHGVEGHGPGAVLVAGQEDLVPVASRPVPPYSKPPFTNNKQ